MTIVEQNQSVEEQPVSSKEKKSVLMKVKDKAKDKMKRIGSKLKSKGHDNEEEKQELVEHSDEVEEEQTLTGVVQPKDLSVPLDEYELMKQKGAENKDDEASAKEGSLRDNLTDGLPTISLAEQEPDGVSSADALQAVPTEYHYKEGSTQTDTNKLAPGESETTSNEVDPPVSGTEPSKLDEATTESSDRSWPQEDFSLKTHGETGGAEEQAETPTLTPGGLYGGTPEVTEKNIQEPEAEVENRDIPELSDRDIQQPDVETKSSTVEEERASDKPDEGELEIGDTGRNIGHEDVAVDTKPAEERQDVKADETSADSKLEDESSLNTVNVRDGVPEDGKEKERDGGSLETDGKPETGESFADAKPVMEPAGVDGNDEAQGERDLTVGKSEEPPAGTEAREPLAELSGTERGEDKKEVSNVPEPGEGVSDVPEPEEKKEVPDIPPPAEEKKEVSEVRKAAGDDQGLVDVPTGTEAVGDDHHAKNEPSQVSSSPEETSRAPGDGITQENGGEEHVLAQVSKEVGDEKVETKDSNESKPEGGERGIEAPPSGSLSQKLAGFKDSIASTFGYSSPNSATNEDKKAEQEQIIDEKATEVLQGSSA